MFKTVIIASTKIGKRKILAIGMALIRIIRIKHKLIE
jgi:hypothetical protein